MDLGNVERTLLWSELTAGSTRLPPARRGPELRVNWASSGWMP